MKQAMWKPMKSQYLESVATVALLIVLVFSYDSRCYADSFAPTWLKKGAYAEYTSASGHMRIFNNTRSSGSDSVDFVDCVFRWECVDLNETTAKLKLTLTYTETERNGKPTGKEDKQLTTEVYVNVLSRAVYLQNGTLIGTTHLWLPASLDPNTDIVMWDVPPDKITIKPTDTTSLGMTPQGKQNAFMLAAYGNGTISGMSVSFHGLWDLDTGVMISDYPRDTEPTYIALGIKRYMAILLFADTNIDLGPGDNPLDLRTIITIIAVPVAFVTIFVAVYMRRRKKR
jgi:hypothetical protein